MASIKDAAIDFMNNKLKPNNLENKIIPQEFVKKWLPDYENRVKLAIEFEKEHFNPEFRNLSIWVENNFPEALEAFAKAICADHASLIIATGAINKNSILNAPMQ